VIAGAPACSAIAKCRALLWSFVGVEAADARPLWLLTYLLASVAGTGRRCSIVCFTFPPSLTLPSNEIVHSGVMHDFIFWGVLI